MPIRREGEASARLRRGAPGSRATTFSFCSPWFLVKEASRDAGYTRATNLKERA